MSRRVVVTGLGLVTPVANSVEGTWAALIEGKSGADYIKKFDTEKFPVRFACEVKNFDPLNYVEKKEARKMGAFIHYAVAASQEAVNDSGLKITDEIAENVGTYISSGIGDFWAIEREHEKLLKDGPGRVSPFFIPSAIVNLAAGQVSIRHNAKGPNSATATACSAGAHAIGDSFDLERDGFVIGEGAGIVILEEYEFARRRGARIYAELVGYGMSGDAFHITMPDDSGSGAVRVMQKTLADAKVKPEEVGYINAHGTSTPYNDKFETLAIKKTFGEHAYKVAISSTKSMTGHLLGAAGGVEGVFSVLSIHRNMLLPTINYKTPDPECDLDYIPNQAREAKVNYALSNSFGFGGTNAALLFKRYEE